MNQNQPELTLDESVKQVMKTLPPVIRTYLAQGKYTMVAKNLMTKYGLRIDQGGVLEREIMLLLMGIENPDEFTKALVEEAKLDQQTINKIAQDVNAQIFVPLREEMRKGPAPVPQPARSAAAQTPPRIVGPAVPQVKPAEVPRPTAQMGRNEPFAPRPQAVAPSARPDLRSVLASVTKEVPPEGRQTSLNPAKLLEDHEEPHIEFKKAPPPANLPGVLQPPTPKPPAPTSAPIQHAEFTKPYSSDPYREPIEP